jgi:hypothetical protein
MSWIKYDYYINNVSKDSKESIAKQNSERLQNTTEKTTEVAQSLELLVEEFFIPIFTF